MAVRTGDFLPHGSDSAFMAGMGGLRQEGDTEIGSTDHPES